MTTAEAIRQARKCVSIEGRTVTTWDGRARAWRETVAQDGWHARAMARSARITFALVLLDMDPDRAAMAGDYCTPIGPWETEVRLCIANYRRYQSLMLDEAR